MNKPLRPCRKAGCYALVSGGYCSAHKPEAGKRSAESEDWHRWYGQPLWKQTLRPNQLVREPFCRECALVGLRTRATVVDHVVPHCGDWALFVDPANHQSLCKRHHDAKTMRELRERGTI